MILLRMMVVVMSAKEMSMLSMITILMMIVIRFMRVIKTSMIYI